MSRCDECRARVARVESAGKHDFHGACWYDRLDRTHWCRDVTIAAHGCSVSACTHRADASQVARSRARGLSRWRRREHASANASGRFGVRRACRFTTSKRARASSSRRRCSAPTSGASGPSRCRACCGWPRSTRSRPISCCRVSSRARSASSTAPASVDRPVERASRSTSCACTTLDDPDAQILSRFASSIQLERQDFNGRMLTIRRSDLRVLAAVHGPQPRRARRPARAARPARRSPPERRRCSEPGFGGRADPRATLTRTLAAPRTTSPPPTTAVKILVPGNHLMVGLLGQRDELLRMSRPRSRCRSSCAATRSPITGDGADAERVGRLFEELVVLLEQGHELDRDGLGRSIEMLKADQRPTEVLTTEVVRGRKTHPAEDGRAEALRRRGARPHRHVRDRPGRHRQELPRGRARGAGAAGEGSEPHHPHPARGRGGRAARASCPATCWPRSTRTCARSTTRSTTCSSPRSSRG